jgi:hypothetical protein
MSFTTRLKIRLLLLKKSFITLANREDVQVIVISILGVSFLIWFLTKGIYLLPKPGYR